MSTRGPTLVLVATACLLGGDPARLTANDHDSKAEVLSPGDPVSLVLDDGTPGPFAGGAATLVLNRFTPDEYPLELHRVDTMWIPGVGGNVEVGDPFFVFLYEDKDADVFSGPSVHRGTFEGVVQSVDSVTFTEFSFDPIVFEGPGDIQVAYSPGTSNQLGWAAMDIDPPLAERSFIINWDGKEMPPQVPDPKGGNGQVHDVNWMARAFGTVLKVPVELLSVDVE